MGEGTDMKHLMKRNQVTACDLWTSDPRVKRAGATPTTDLDHHRP